MAKTKRHAKQNPSPDKKGKQIQKRKAERYSRHQLSHQISQLRGRPVEYALED